jgi:hypothetical protein
MRRDREPLNFLYLFDWSKHNAAWKDNMSSSTLWVGFTISFLP